MELVTWLVRGKDPCRPIASSASSVDGRRRIMVVLEYDASAGARPKELPTFSSAPFFFDRTKLNSDGTSDLNPGSLLADARSVQSHFHAQVSYYFPVGVSDYVRKFTLTTALRRTPPHEACALGLDESTCAWIWTP